MRNNPALKQVKSRKKKGSYTPSIHTSFCPACGYELDAASGLDHRDQPSSGDLSVCLNCGAYLQFNDILIAKPMPQEVMGTLDAKTIHQLAWLRSKILQRGLIHKREL